MKNGFSTLIMVLTITVVLTIFLVAMQSRYFLAFNRKQAYYDLMNSSYQAEFEMTDMGIKMAYYPGFVPSTYSKDLGNGRTLTVNNQINNMSGTTGITARWPNATSVMQLGVSKVGNIFNKYNKVDLVLGFDCSPSMNDPVSPSDSRPKIRVAQDALNTILGQIKTLPSRDQSRINLGFIASRRAAAWVQTPSNDHTMTEQFINQKVWNSISDSWVCSLPDSVLLPPVGTSEAGTNLGDIGMLANSYFKVNPQIKKILTIVSDGLPNTAFANRDCGTYECSIPESVGTCTDNSIDYLKCSLSPKNYQWKPGVYGQRLPDVDVYALILQPNPSTGGPIEDAYLKTIHVFDDLTYVKKDYVTPDSLNISNALSEVFSEITMGVDQISFTRLQP